MAAATAAASYTTPRGATWARERAVLRLSQLYRGRLLTADEEGKFAEALWDPPEAPIGLPGGTGLRDWFFLKLPQPTPGRAEQAFRTAYLSTDGARYLASLEGDYQFLRNIHSATHSEDDAPSLLSLTPDEAALLRDKVLAWWRGRDVHRADRSEESRLATDLWFAVEDREFRRALVDTLADVILPSLAPSAERCEEIAVMVEELDAAGFQMEPAFPALIRLRPELRERLAVRLRRSLASSDDREAANAAVSAVFRWLRDGSSLDIGAPPEDLSREIAIAISTRRPSNLDSALEAAEWMFRKAPETVNEVFVNLIAEGLGYLLEETRYERQNTRDVGTAFADLPLLRARSAKLAKTMADAGYANEVAVTEWLELAQSDPLPEVRFAAGHHATAPG